MYINQSCCCHVTIKLERCLGYLPFVLLFAALSGTCAVDGFDCSFSNSWRVEEDGSEKTRTAATNLILELKRQPLLVPACRFLNWTLQPKTVGRPRPRGHHNRLLLS